ncbi:hypothetical protein GCM10027425_25010 [Alteromonas gracilis]
MSRMRWRPSERLLVRVGVLLAIAGGLALFGQIRSLSVVEQDGVRVHVAGWHMGPGSSDAMAWGGRLAVVGDGCLGVRSEGDDLVVLWPAGTDVERVDEEVAVDVPDVGRLALGDEIGFAVMLSRHDLRPVRRDCGVREVVQIFEIDRLG